MNPPESGAANSATGLKAPISAGFALPPVPPPVTQESAQSRDELDLRAVAIRALRAIDAVHVDGVMPRIPIVAVPSATSGSAGNFIRDKSGQPVQLEINTHPDYASTAELTFLHEVAHFLDLSGLGIPGQKSTETADPILNDWRVAVRGTRVVQRLEANLRTGYAELVDAQGARRRVPISPHLTRYLLSESELWARSYAQYIAVRSGDAKLIAALDEARFGPNQNALLAQVYPLQWHDADFAPVAKAIDAMFEELGWIL